MIPKPTPGKGMTSSELNQTAKAESYRQKVVFRMLGKIPTIAANCYRHRQGRPFNKPMPTENYVENLLFMIGFYYLIC
jgi:citrate synthase